MSKEIISLLTIWLICMGCSVSKKAKPCTQCPQYSITTIPISDTFYVHIPHHNYNMICYPATRLEFITYDTLYIDNLKQ